MLWQDHFENMLTGHSDETVDIYQLPAAPDKESIHSLDKLKERKVSLGIAGKGWCMQREGDLRFWVCEHIFQTIAIRKAMSPGLTAFYICLVALLCSL